MFFQKYAAIGCRQGKRFKRNMDWLENWIFELKVLFIEVAVLHNALLTPVAQAFLAQSLGSSPKQRGWDPMLHKFRYELLLVQGIPIRGVFSIGQWSDPDIPTWDRTTIHHSNAKPRCFQGLEKNTKKSNLSHCQNCITWHPHDVWHWCRFPKSSGYSQITSWRTMTQYILVLGNLVMSHDHDLLVPSGYLT